MLPNNRSEKTRESVVRDQILEHLGEVIQSLLNPSSFPSTIYVKPSPNSNCPPNTKVFGSSDLTSALCNALEAVLIHGIKDAYSMRLSKMFKGDGNKMPNPNFWPAILSFCHKDDIKEVLSLTYITSDVGRSRAWLRLMLNGGQVTSYIEALSREAAVLRDYYRANALLRCADSVYRLIGVIAPLGSLHFQLATNSGMLNSWTQTPLVISGLWVPKQGHTVPMLHATVVPPPPTPEEDEYLSLHEEMVNESLRDEEDLQDQILLAILAATPSTDMIEAPNEANTPTRRPIVVKALLPRDGSQESQDVEELSKCNQDVSENKHQTLELNQSFNSCSIQSDEDSILTAASSLDVNTLISRRLDNMDPRFVNLDPMFNMNEEEETKHSSTSSSGKHCYN